MNLFDNWKIERWETSISDVKKLIMVSLFDDEWLKIIIKNKESPENFGWSIIFEQYPAYRNIKHDFHLELWKHLEKTGQLYGNTFTVINSDWIRMLKTKEVLLDVAYPVLQHYVIALEKNVIEVLSPKPPIIVVNTPVLMDKIIK